MQRKVINCNTIHSLRRCFSVKVGDKVPISYLKDQKDPIIKDDKEYPDWVHSLHIKGADKLALLNKLNTNEKEMTMDEARRLKRLLTLDDIREANALKGAAKSGN